MSAWQIVQPGGFGASLEDELFDELDREEQEHRKKPLESDSADDSEEEEDDEVEEEEEEGNKQPWTHLCVLDFEACREELEGGEWVYEITELPVTLLNCTTLKVEDRFHRYCRPERITPAVLQRYVDRKYGDMGQAESWHEGAVSLQTALHDLERWLREKDLLLGDNADEQPAKFAFITCGDWDFKNALPRNCDLLGLPVPPFMQQWINVKTVYQKFYKTRRPPAGMTTMLRALDIPLEGTHHFGKDDANNIAKVVQRMIGDGCVFFITGRECDMWHKHSGDRGQTILPSPPQEEEEEEGEDDSEA